MINDIPQNREQLCQQCADCLLSSSRSRWIRRYLDDISWKVLNVFGIATPHITQGIGSIPMTKVSLNLHPGDLVRVKNLPRIRETLDERGTFANLFFMPEMRAFCGQTHVVLKRVNHIILESSGQLRKLKNIVLLEGVLCNGEFHYQCDRSCFFFWNEAWLESVEEN